jgi:hypothetical protein
MRAVKIIPFLVFGLCFFFVVCEAGSQSLPGFQVPGAGQDSSSGRSYTARQGSGQTSNSQPAPVPAVNPSNPVPGAVDVFKKAGGFFGR